MCRLPVTFGGGIAMQKESLLVSPWGFEVTLGFPVLIERLFDGVVIKSLSMVSPYSGWMESGVDSSWIEGGTVRAAPDPVRQGRADPHLEGKPAWR